MFFFLLLPKFVIFHNFCIFFFYIYICIVSCIWKSFEHNCIANSETREIKIQYLIWYTTDNWAGYGKSMVYLWLQRFCHCLCFLVDLSVSVCWYWSVCEWVQWANLSCMFSVLLFIITHRTQMHGGWRESEKRNYCQPKMHGNCFE